jgi:hypothetical protein
VLGTPARDIYPGDNPVVATLERVYRTGVPETLHAERPYYADGKHAERYFTRSFAPLRDEQSQVRGVMTAGYEVTSEVREQVAQREAERRSRLEL